jgi:tRNA threonylcarbamoyl adenosine modification protein (Sua5/YciO/YrdC/YwlC family)
MEPIAAELIEEAVDAVRRGEIVGFPTDTLYGIGVDPYSEGAIDGLFRLKQRPSDKPMALLVASIDQAMALAEFEDTGLDLADRHWPGGLTLILPRLAQAPPWLGDAARRTIGLRCPDHPVALALLAAAGPLVVTSANRTGQEPAVDDTGARALLGDAVSLYLPGSSPGGVASTVMDLTKPSPLVLRPGPVREP